MSMMRILECTHALPPGVNKLVLLGSTWMKFEWHVTWHDVCITAFECDVLARFSFDVEVLAWFSFRTCTYKVSDVLCKHTLQGVCKPAALPGTCDFAQPEPHHAYRQTHSQTCVAVCSFQVFITRGNFFSWHIWIQPCQLITWCGNNPSQTWNFLSWIWKFGFEFRGLASAVCLLPRVWRPRTYNGKSLQLLCNMFRLTARFSLIVLQFMWQQGQGEQVYVCPETVCFCTYMRACMFLARLQLKTTLSDAIPCMAQHGSK